MAVKPSPPAGRAQPANRAQPKSVSTMIREAIDRNGYKDVKECARSIKVPYDLFNKVVGGHIPKDAQLVEYAKKLQIDGRELILAAYREKAPEEMKPYFNSVVLLEDHNEQVREVRDLVDGFNADQMEELLNVARIIKQSSRRECRKAIALVSLYQQMDEELMGHFESLVLLALQNATLSGLKDFHESVNHRPSGRSSRRGRLLA